VQEPSLLPYNCSPSLAVPWERYRPRVLTGPRLHLHVQDFSLLMAALCVLHKAMGLECRKRYTVSSSERSIMRRWRNAKNRCSSDLQSQETPRNDPAPRSRCWHRSCIDAFPPILAAAARAAD